MRTNRVWIAGAVGMLLVAARGQETVRISTNVQGLEGNADSDDPSITPDGRLVVFASDASNLVPQDTNSHEDVFLRDRATGEVQLLSRDLATGTPGDADSSRPRISADGRFVCFESDATDLVPGDTNGEFDVFRVEIQTGAILRVSVSSVGAEGNAYSNISSISADGRYVAFQSGADNLVPGDLNGARDVFVHDTQTGVTEIASVATGGALVNSDSGYPDISRNGRFVVFESDATNIVLGDTNGCRDIFLRDRQLDLTTRVSVTTAGAELQGESYCALISGSGQFVVFQTDAPAFPMDLNNTTDVCLRDVFAGTLLGVSHAFNQPTVSSNGYSSSVAISDDGRWITYAATSSDIVAGDTNGTRDIFRHERATGARVRVSLSDSGAQSTGACLFTDVSDDGQVAFRSTGADLVVGDSGSHDDVFVRNLGPDFPELYCSGKQNSMGCVPFLNFSGIASATSAAPFSIQGRDFLPGESGFLIYGVNGKSNLDFHGGKLCVKLPFSRWLPFKQAVKKGTGTCGGVLKRNFNARIQAGVDPQLTAGQVVDAQWLQRDPGDPAGFGDSLSNGIRFTIGS